MRRFAYVLTVDCKESDAARYQRRGVKVLSLLGSKANYDKIFATFFEELRDYWPAELYPMVILLPIFVPSKFFAISELIQEFSSLWITF